MMLKNKITFTVIAIAVSGCQSAPNPNSDIPLNESHYSGISEAALITPLKAQVLISHDTNRLKIDEMKFEGVQIKEQKPKIRTATKLVENLNSGVSVKGLFNAEQVFTEHKGIYHAYKTETFEETIHRWLKRQGFKTIGKLLSRPSKDALNTFLAEEFVFSDSLTGAIEQLKTKMPKEAKNVQILLNENKKQAIITDELVPVEMHIIPMGNTKDAFIALSNNLGWQAKPEFYLSRHNYEIPFSYPVVIKSGDAISAFEQFLSPFADLKAQLSSSTNQAFVIGERE